MSLIKKRLLGITLLLAACCAAVGGLVWQENRDIAAEQAKESASKVLSLDKARVTEITLNSPAGSFALGRSAPGAEAWAVNSPMQTAADAMVVDGMLQAALDLRSTGEVGGAAPPPPADLSLFGLQPPRYSLHFKTQDGASQTLFVGKKNAYDGSLYVKRDDRPNVDRVGGDFAYQLDQDLYKLREKRPAIFAADDVVKLQVVPAAGPGYTLERGPSGLALTAPLQSPADEALANQVLGALAGLRAKSFAAESAPTAAARHPFGLDKPSHTAVVQLKDQRTFTLLFGTLSLAGETHSFVMEQGEHPVLELGSDWASKKLSMSAQELRDMHVLAFDKDAVRHITLSRGKELLSFAQIRDPAAGTQNWRATAPTEAPVQGSKINALLYKLASLKADSVAQEKPSTTDLTARGLEAPELRIDLQGENNQSLGSIVFGTVDSTQSDKRFVTSDKHARIDRVAASSSEDISANLADYQETATAKSN